METVALLKCTDYEVENIERKLREGFELLGGESFLRELIPANSRVLLKPNFLSAVEKGSPVITHCAVFEAVIRIIKDYSSSISFGDSPGTDSPAKAAERSGFMEVAGRYGVKSADFSTPIHVELDNAIMYKYWDIAQGAVETDVLITLPKLKTHGMMYYTGAVKNQFGCVPGFRKAEWHTKQRDPYDFSKMLLDLNSMVRTSFAILDGIVAMEGNGPRNGNPRQVNAIIMGKALTAVDSVAVRLIGYNNVLDVPHLKAAQDYKWGAVLPGEINVLGEKINNMRCKGFKLAREKFIEFSTPAVNRFLTQLIAPNPVLVPDKCISCFKCKEVCPEKPNVITFKDFKGKKIPTWNYSKCIRCFCCQELCPEGAIIIKNKAVRDILKIK